MMQVQRPSEPLSPRPASVRSSTASSGYFSQVTRSSEASSAGGGGRLPKSKVFYARGRVEDDPQLWGDGALRLHRLSERVPRLRAEAEAEGVLLCAVVEQCPPDAPAPPEDGDGEIVEWVSDDESDWEVEESLVWDTRKGVARRRTSTRPAAPSSPSSSASASSSSSSRAAAVGETLRRSASRVAEKITPAALSKRTTAEREQQQQQQQQLAEYDDRISAVCIRPPTLAERFGRPTRRSSPSDSQNKEAPQHCFAFRWFALRRRPQTPTDDPDPRASTSPRRSIGRSMLRVSLQCDDYIGFMMKSKSKYAISDNKERKGVRRLFHCIIKSLLRTMAAR